MKFQNARFRKHVNVKPEGSATLGFLDVDAVADGVTVTLRDLAVRITRDGKPSLSAPSRSYKLASGETRRASAYRFDDATYERLLAGIFALPDVASARQEAERTDNAGAAIA